MSLLKDLETIVNIRSFTNDQEAVNKVQSYLFEKFNDAGFICELFKDSLAGDLLVARNVNKKNKPQILLLGHADIVPNEEFNDFKTVDDKCYGNGVADMKAGLIVILGIMQQLNSNLYNITCVISPDEEYGSLAHQKRMYEIYKTVDYVFVFEPGLENNQVSWPSGRWLINKRKGLGEFSVSIKGPGGHAANELKNRQNVIEEMAYKILAWQKLTNLERGITTNVGLIKGGQATNIIAPNCEAGVDIRAITKSDYQELINKCKEIALQNKLDVESQWQLLLGIAPLEPNAKADNLMQLAKEYYFKKNIEVVDSLRGVGSDGNQAGQFGAGVLDGLGGVGANLHRPDEWIYKDSIIESIDLVVDVIKKL
ncbi:MAG: hypothetical protein AUJ28_01355 [Parcubacteria group bacterium CG1_02_37_51]|uniref:Peptidase M20 dimerisation domain-containing protein n=1 Tax=Candidatus Komeilibacteria bacterium CG_4_10_14_0_8_um_filter_37_78 TaxID=1974471 RepID=A0A2M7RF77_9BACT|nr:MAG: hypothetical protein AUJ28_01355 [Parcubacteria group bacterium CG1_02_37_51]PIY95388.1 MAG: hypothetical protein COY67_00270 [Candidatus Komeilibacteria bacterium CG_4_10_14_0_8_um_filter_37_78]